MALALTRACDGLHILPIKPYPKRDGLVQPRCSHAGSLTLALALALVALQVNALKLGALRDPMTAFGPVINQAALDKACLRKGHVRVQNGVHHVWRSR